MPDLNYGSLLIDARNASHELIRNASAEFLLYNHRLQSLNARYAVKLAGQPLLLTDVPAFPNGSADLILNIDRYRSKKRFVNVFPEEDTPVNEVFFLDPAKAKAKFPSLAKLKRDDSTKPLATLLANSPAIDYDSLTDLQKAGLLNLWAKSSHVTLGNGTTVFEHLERLEEVRPARLFARVQLPFIDAVTQSRRVFHEVSGLAHSFSKGWQRLEGADSFKTIERQGNLQVTFATDTKGDKTYLVDMDIDDHQGLEHAFDVIGHTLAGGDTHPFDIHQVLLALQGIDPGYELS